MMSFLGTLRARFFGPSRIYADYAAATPVSSEVIEEMSRALHDLQGNPASVHSGGRFARTLLEAARTRAARVLSVHADEVVFTSGGTESNNLALLGAVRASDGARPHLITSVIEHGSVLEPLRCLVKDGAELTLLPVNANGRISLEDLSEALRPETLLVSVAFANGEIGSVERIRDISRVLKAYREKLGRGKHEAPYFHTDASQAGLYFSVHPGDLGVDLLTLDAGKLHGPTGVGLLYVRRGLSLEPLFYGGGQERGLRSGTENIPGAIGFAAALERAALSRKNEGSRLRKLSLHFKKRLKELLPTVEFNGSPEEGLPHIVNVTVPGIDAEFILVKLDTLGVSASSASACRSIAANGASYVIEALPGRVGAGASSLRFSFGGGTTQAEVERIALILQGVVG